MAQVQQHESNNKYHQKIRVYENIY